MAQYKHLYLRMVRSVENKTDERSHRGTKEKMRTKEKIAFGFLPLLNILTLYSIQVTILFASRSKDESAVTEHYTKPLLWDLCFLLEGRMLSGRVGGSFFLV
jgi:hypothetical protein